MMLHAVCICVKIVPESVKHETNVVTLPTDEFDNCDDAWNFAKEALADFLPESIEVEDKLTLLDDDNTEHGFFFPVQMPNRITTITSLLNICFSDFSYN